MFAVRRHSAAARRALLHCLVHLAQKGPCFRLSGLQHSCHLSRDQIGDALDHPVCGLPRDVVRHVAGAVCGALVFDISFYRAYPRYSSGFAGPGKPRHPSKGGGDMSRRKSPPPITCFQTRGAEGFGFCARVASGPGQRTQSARLAACGSGRALVCGGVRVWAKNRLRRCQCRCAVQKKSMLF